MGLLVHQKGHLDLCPENFWFSSGKRFLNSRKEVLKELPSAPLFSFHSRVSQLIALFLDTAHDMNVHHKTFMELVRAAKHWLCCVDQCLVRRGCPLRWMSCEFCLLMAFRYCLASGESQKTLPITTMVVKISPNGKHWRFNLVLL